VGNRWSGSDTRDGCSWWSAGERLREGQHTVLFSDTAQGSWVTQKSAFEPNKIVLSQVEIPSSTMALVPWDVCIADHTALPN
jgi:hypothetical protein